MESTTPTTLTKYTGSCHCKAITYEAELDLAKGTSRCNCTVCSKARAWETITSPANFKFTGNKELLGDYQFNTKMAHHHFCKNCGIKVYGTGHLAELGGDFVAIYISTIDNITPKELTELKVTYMNGRDDAWYNQPEHYTHL